MNICIYLYNNTLLLSYNKKKRQGLPFLSCSYTISCEDIRNLWQSTNTFLYFLHDHEVDLDKNLLYHLYQALAPQMVVSKQLHL